MKNTKIETTIEANGRKYNISCNKKNLDLYEEIVYKGYSSLSQIYTQFNINKSYEYAMIENRHIKLATEIKNKYKNSYISELKIINYNNFMFTTGEVIYDNNDIYIITNCNKIDVKCITKNTRTDKDKKEGIIKYKYLTNWDEKGYTPKNPEGIVEEYEQYKQYLIMKNYEYILNILNERLNIDENEMNSEDVDELNEHIFNIVHDFTVDKTYFLFSSNRFINRYERKIIDEIYNISCNNIEDDVGCIYYY